MHSSKFGSIFKHLHKSNEKVVSGTDDDISDCSEEPENAEELQLEIDLSCSEDSNDENRVANSKTPVTITNHKAKQLCIKRKNIPVQIQHRTAEKRKAKTMLELSNSKLSSTNAVKLQSELSPLQKSRKMFSSFKSNAATYMSPNRNINIQKNVDLNTCSKQSCLLAYQAESQEIEFSSSSCQAATQEIENSYAEIAEAQDADDASELDLLLNLIEAEAVKDAKTIAQQLSSKAPHSAKKSRRPKCGGYVQLLQQTLAAAHADRRFLEHDKKLGLQSGVILQVKQLHTRFGVVSACAELIAAPTNCSLQLNSCVQLPLDKYLAENVRIGSQLEAFLDIDSPCYTIERASTYLIAEANVSSTCSNDLVFIKPNKLLLLQN